MIETCEILEIFSNTKILFVSYFLSSCLMLLSPYSKGSRFLEFQLGGLWAEGTLKYVLKLIFSLSLSSLWCLNLQQPIGEKRI